MPFERATIYFASGTGNSFRVAEWIADRTDAMVVPIERADPANEIQASAGQLVGVCFPTHGLMPPWSMIKFLLRFPRRPGARALVVATRGCFKLGPLFVPGIAGLATFMAGLLLLIKGCRPLGGLGLDMPSNVLNVHWGLHPDNVRAIIDRARSRLDDRFLTPVLDGQLRWLTLNALWEASWAAVLIVLYPLFFPLYLIIGKLFMAKLFFTSDDCNGCGACARACPNDAIKMVGADDSKRPFWTFACEACIRCMGYCKKRAVQVSHPWVVLLIYLGGFTSAAAAQSVLHRVCGLRLSIDGLVADLLSLALTYPMLIVAYYVLWGLARQRWMNLILTRSTPVFYFRRFHEPSTRMSQMTKVTKSSGGPGRGASAGGAGPTPGRCSGR